MARFDSGIFGLMRGKIGNIVARLRYGKVYVSSKPGKHRAKQTEAAKRNRAIFSRRQRLNKGLRKDDNIRKFWKVVESEGLNHNTKPMKRNTPYVAYERLLPGAGFTPNSEEKIIVKNIHLEGGTIQFDFKIERTNPRKLKLPYDLYCIVLADRWFEYSESQILRKKDIATATRHKRIETEQSDAFQTVSLIFNTAFVKNIEYSEKCYVMFAAIKFNEQKNKYEWTDTYFEEISDLVPNDMKQEVNGRTLRFED